MRRQQGIMSVVAIALIAVGCLGTASAAPNVIALTLGTKPAFGQDPLFWDGNVLNGTGGRAAICTPANCDLVPFSVQPHPSYWLRNEGAIEVSIRWEYWENVAFQLEIQDSSGQTITAGFGGFGVSAFIDRADGDYTAMVKAVRGSGSYEGVLQVETRPLDRVSTEILADLVAVRPGQISLRGTTPLFVNGCAPDEIAASQALRCLRVSSGIGNAGEGRLAVRMSPEQSALAIGGVGQFLQRIYNDDGTFREVMAGTATYHAVHRHFHYGNLAHFDLYAYDSQTGRGPLLRTSAKTGFCFIDSGLVSLGLTGTMPATPEETGCVTPTSEEGWVMEIRPSWYDFYHSGLSDQFVEISGLPDGVYEIEFVVNDDGSLIETDYANNTASTVIEIREGDVTERIP